LFGYEIVPEPLANHFPLLHWGLYCMAGGPRFGKNLIGHAKQTNVFLVVFSGSDESATKRLSGVNWKGFVSSPGVWRSSLGSIPPRRSPR
jgi:hypothetical protein